MSRSGRTAPRPRILIVEDDREVRHLLEVVLAGEGRDVVAVGTAEQAERALDEAPASLVVLDLILPDTDGRSLLAGLRATPGTARVPIVVVSGRSTPDVRAECYALGADRFVEKPLDPEEMAADVSARLQRAVGSASEERADHLTGLLNRAGIRDAVERHRGAGAPYAVAFAEIDGVRALFDRHGWGTVERMIFEVAGRLRATLPDDVALGRVAGGEFAAVVGGTRVPEAEMLARSMVETVRRLPVEGPDRETFRFTLSAGLVRSGEAPSTEGLIDLARARSFRAAEAGGNRLAAGEVEAAADPLPVLVAEDDDIAATLLTHRLEREGFRVIRHADGHDAYEAALSLRPALVILDVKMPGMDGFEVLERLRRTPSYAGVPVLMLTAMGGEADIVRAFDLGADDYMLKPFSPAELVARVRRLLRRDVRASVD